MSKRTVIFLPEELLEELDAALPRLREEWGERRLCRSDVIHRALWIILHGDTGGATNGATNGDTSSATSGDTGGDTKVPPLVPQHHAPTVRAYARADRSIDREIEGEECLKNRQQHSPAPPPGRLEKKSESMIPGEVQALKAEYLHHAPDLVEEVLQFIAERESRRYLPPDRQLLVLQAWKWKPGDPPKEWAMSRRVWALRTVMKNRKTVTDPEAYMLSLLERGPKQPRPPDRNQTALALGENNEPPEWRELRERWFYIPKEDMFAPPRLDGKPDWQSARKLRPQVMPVPEPPDPCCNYKGYRR